jgi:hypothetical protein
MSAQHYNNKVHHNSNSSNTTGNSSAHNFVAQLLLLNQINHYLQNSHNTTNTTTTTTTNNNNNKNNNNSNNNSNNNNNSNHNNYNNNQNPQQRGSPLRTIAQMTSKQSSSSAAAEIQSNQHTSHGPTTPNNVANSVISPTSNSLLDGLGGDHNQSNAASIPLAFNNTGNAEELMALLKSRLLPLIMQTVNDQTGTIDQNVANSLLIDSLNSITNNSTARISSETSNEVENFALNYLKAIQTSGASFKSIKERIESLKTVVRTHLNNTNSNPVQSPSNNGTGDNANNMLRLLGLNSPSIGTTNAQTSDLQAIINAFNIANSGDGSLNDNSHA